jgi:hypothetical protein
MTVADQYLDDPTYVAIRDGFRRAYDQAATIVAARVEARLASTATFVISDHGITDQLLTDEEWTMLLADDVVDDIGDSVFDGAIAAAVLFGVLAADARLRSAVDEEVSGIRLFGSFLRRMLDDWWQRGVTEGWGSDEFVDRVRTDSPVSPTRADTAADLHHHSGVNHGVHEGLDAAANTPSDPFDGVFDEPDTDVAALQWITQRDDKVRDAHAAIDADVVANGTPFTMVDPKGGVFEARFPGDPTLPIGLRINCRCVLGYVDGAAVRRAINATRNELLRTARDLNIRGRHRMTKPELQSAVLKQLCLHGLAAGDDCPDLLERMNRTALVTLARTERIPRRHSMNRAELVEALSTRLRPGSAFDIARGYADTEALAEARSLAASKRRTAPAPTGTGSLPRPEARLAAREALFDEFGGPLRGYVPCPFCGLKLGADPDGDLAVLMPDPIVGWSDGGTTAAANLIPSCVACFQTRGGRGRAP